MRHRMIGLVFVSAVGCLDRELQQIDPQVQSGPTIHLVQGGANDVDLLVLVDNSGSMEEEQANLTANMPILIDALTTETDRDGDGDLDPAVDSLHIGVISTDMGTGGIPVHGCDQSERGDDGVLQNLPSTSVEGCDATYPRFLSYEATNPDDSISNDFTCIATLGTGGCGFEQQLAAVEKALTVHAQPGAANAEFLRDEAVLAILLVTDEEDCSVADPTIFTDDDARLGIPNLRCFQNPEMVRPVEELVTSILGVKAKHPEDFVVAAIAGVPPDLVALGPDDLASNDIQTAEDYERILADPRMQEVVDFSPEGNGARLTPSCNVEGLGLAYPPRRIVDFVSRIDDETGNGIVQSICQSDWGPTMAAITRLISGTIDDVCLPRPLQGAGGIPLRSGEHAECVVREILTDSRDCGPGRFAVDTDEDGRTICQVCQLGDGEGDHLVDAEGRSLASCAGSVENWRYTTEECEGAGRIVFTTGATPEQDSEVFLQCITTVGG